jgi:alkylation response protein AidB-like acyl-CoA dehydrogenase
MDYSPRPDDQRFLLDCVLQAAPRLRTLVPFADFDADLQAQVLEAAGKFVAERIAPLNAGGDLAGCRLSNGAVSMPPGFVEAYRAFWQSGWPALAAEPEHGGQGLPALLEAVLYEWLSAANHGFTMAPALLHGAYECLRQHGSTFLREHYLNKIATGQWLATMCLTEPQAGSDLGLVRTRTAAQPDGSERVNGAKIFISGGEHDLSENIIHLVLARRPGAPPGAKGLSLVLVPKWLPDGARNAVYCEGIEHKMGLHASPTCQMRFDQAVGWLVGASERGLAAMFSMMNAARLHVALQVIRFLDAAWQNADACARQRRPMRAPAPAVGHGGSEADLIVEHPAMRRILDTQRAWIDGARLIAYRTALLLDVARHAGDAAVRERAQRWCALATPVLKAACTEQGFVGISACLQVFGGHGYVRDSGIEQHLRDARVTMLYEGTNEIQAIDLLVRKVLPDAGAALAAALIELRDELDPAREADADAQRRMAQLRYLGTMITLAAKTAPSLPYEVADDYLRVVMLTFMAWAWARIEAAAGAGDIRWRAPAAAFRRWVLPEFDMRLAIIKRACDAINRTPE